MKLMEKNNNNQFGSFAPNKTVLGTYSAKHFSGANDPKWVKMAFENLNISFISFHKVLFALSICTTLLFVVF